MAMVTTRCLDRLQHSTPPRWNPAVCRTTHPHHPLSAHHVTSRARTDSCRPATDDHPWETTPGRAHNRQPTVPVYARVSDPLRTITTHHRYPRTALCATRQRSPATIGIATNAPRTCSITAGRGAARTRTQTPCGETPGRAPVTTPIHRTRHLLAALAPPPEIVRTQHRKGRVADPVESHRTARRQAHAILADQTTSRSSARASRISPKAGLATHHQDTLWRQPTA